MNKKDFLLIIIILVIVIILMLFIKQEKGTIATVYYDNNKVLDIDLNKNKEYDIKGYNGNIHIVVKNNYISVTDEISPRHICRNKKIHNVGESIICLPNKVVIKIEGNDLDTVIGD